MRKFLVLLCFAILAFSMVMACKPPGFPCTDDSDCCAPMACNPWAGRCTKKPTVPGWGQPEDPATPPADEQQ